MRVYVSRSSEIEIEMLKVFHKGWAGESLDWDVVFSRILQPKAWCWTIVEHLCSIKMGHVHNQDGLTLSGDEWVSQASLGLEAVERHLTRHQAVRGWPVTGVAPLKALVDFVGKLWGGVLDGLVNNVGTNIRKNIEEERETWNIVKQDTQRGFLDELYWRTGHRWNLDANKARLRFAYILFWFEYQCDIVWNCYVHGYSSCSLWAGKFDAVSLGGDLLWLLLMASSGCWVIIIRYN